MKAAYLERDGDAFVPDAVAQGGWGPTVGGQVVGGLLARAVEEQVRDAEMQPARLTVDIMRRVALEPMHVTAHAVRTGRRMSAVDATVSQGGEAVARASALFLRRSESPADEVWSTPVTMPPPPEAPDADYDDNPMFIRGYGRNGDHGGAGVEWQHLGPKYAWVCEVRPLVGGEEPSPFVRAAMAVDVTATVTNFGPAGLKYINADYTMSLTRLPEGPFVGLAAITHYANAGVATGTASLFDARGPIGSSMSTAIANPNFLAAGSYHADSLNK